MARERVIEPFTLVALLMFRAASDGLVGRYSLYIGLHIEPRVLAARGELDQNQSR